MKNLTNYTNPKEIGSYHWYNTLLSEVGHIGRFLEEKTPNEEILRAWGLRLSNISKDLNEYRNKINKEKHDNLTILREAFDKIEKTL